MNSIDDERLLFYLARKELIDRWAAGRRDEAVALDQFCTTLEPEVSALAQRLGAFSFSDTFGGTSLLGIHRPEWQIGDERPAALVSLAWFNLRSSDKNRASFTDPGCVPWIGVRTRRTQPYDVATGKLTAWLASSAGGEFPATDGPKDSWPAYSWEPKADDVPWTDLSAYRRQLLDRLAQAWDTFEHTIGADLSLGFGPESV